MWDQFFVYKDSVNAALNRARIDTALRAEYNAQLALVQNEIVTLAASTSVAVPRRPTSDHWQYVTPLYAKQVPLFYAAATAANNDVAAAAVKESVNEERDRQLEAAAFKVRAV